MSKVIHLLRDMVFKIYPFPVLQEFAFQVQRENVAVPDIGGQDSCSESFPPRYLCQEANASCYKVESIETLADTDSELGWGQVPWRTPRENCPNRIRCRNITHNRIF